MKEYDRTRCTRVVDRSKTVQSKKILRSQTTFERILFYYQALARYKDLRSAGAMEEYNRTRCTRVVDRSKTVQNRKAFEPYFALVNGLLKCL
jgi:hypothetical protein